MNHCAGGPSTDQFDAFGALVNWVEKDVAPDRIVATARMGTPWPGRTRPLCAYPQRAVYKGSGSIDEAASFACRQASITQSRTADADTWTATRTHS